MTIFGVIWMALLLGACLKRKDEYIVILLLLSGVLQCDNVFVIGGRGVGPFVITSITYVLRYLFTNSSQVVDFVKEKSNTLLGFVKMSQKSYTVISIWLIGAISVSLVANFLLANGYLLYLGVIFGYIACFVTIHKIGNNISERNVQRIVLGVIDFVLIMGAVQFLIFVLNIPRDNFIATLFYNDNVGLSLAYYSAPEIRLFSTFMEPSYCGAFLVGAMFYICSNYKNIKYGFVRICVVGMAIILTKSTTAYIALVLCGLLFMFYGRNKELLKKLLPFVLVGVLIIILSGAFSSVIMNKLKTGSAYSRAYWNAEALKQFLKSPIFGIGYKNSRASSFIYTLLSEQGLIGLFAFGLLVFKNFSLLRRKDVPVRITPAVWFFMGVLICMIIAVPDYDFCVLWMTIYILGLSIKKEEVACNVGFIETIENGKNTIQ